jgi:hypothetical protein
VLSPVLGYKQSILSIERLTFWGNMAEQYVLYPLLILAMVTHAFPRLQSKYGDLAAAIIASLCGLKIARCAFSDRTLLWPSVAVTVLLFGFDFEHVSETMLLDLYVVTVVMSKVEEVYLKLHFMTLFNSLFNMKEVLNTSLSLSTFVLSTPHFSLFAAIAVVSSLCSAPFYPFKGSLLFMASYMRPVKFWERSYETRLLDATNTRLGNQYNAEEKANNLNSLFYLQMVGVLKRSLCDDVDLGRFGNVSAGDFFILLDADNRMTVILHIIERGNGHLGFQIRGLEFTGSLEYVFLLFFFFLS